MELQPKRPPGRTDRKAARYIADIARLRSAGYTYEAIREALAEVDQRPHGGHDDDLRVPAYGTARVRRAA